MSVRRSIRFPLLGIALLALLAGLWAGLLRLGWSMPLSRPDLSLTHGPLMVCGFLGTLIGVERAVALGRPWTFLGPLLTAVSALALIGGVSGPFAALTMTVGSAGLLLMFGVIIHAQPALFTVTSVSSKQVIAYYKGRDFRRLSFQQLACSATCPDHNGPLQACGLTCK